MKKSTIIKFFAGLLAIELVGMAVWIWPDVLVRIFRPTANPSMVLSDNSPLGYLVASPTEWLAPTLQSLHPTRFPVLFTGTWTSAVTFDGTATSTGISISTSRGTPNYTLTNPPERSTSTRTFTPIYSPTHTRTPPPTDTPIPSPTDTPVPPPTDTPVPPPTDTLVPPPTDTLVPPPTDTLVPPPTDTPAG